MSTSPESSPDLPLFDLHRRLGAVLTTVDGREGVPASYGDGTAERAALIEAAGLVDRSWLDRLEVLGEDRHRFLNGQVTCDVKALANGELTYGFFTSRQGKIQADVTVLALDDRLWLELPSGRGGEVRAHLEKFILVDRVEIHSLVGRVPLAVVGPRAAAILAGAGAAVPEADGRHVESDLLGTRVQIARQPLCGLPAVTLWLPKEDAPFLAEDLLGREGAEQLRPVGFEALETVRVESGVPRFGADFGPDHFPQETGLDHAVSYTKGCYLGQEVVARIHYRGQVNRLLRGLVFEAPQPPGAGAELLHEGRIAGTVGTATLSPAMGMIGLAILHRRAAEVGTVLEVAGGGRAEVRELPWGVPRPPG